MKWFYKLNRKIRIVIAVLAWLPFVVSALVINSMLGGNVDNMSGGQAAIVLLCLAVGIFFTVFAVKARRLDMPAAPVEKSPTAPPSTARSNTPPTQTVKPAPVLEDKKAASPIIRKPAPLPLYDATVAVECFDNRVKSNGIINISVGDKCTIKFQESAAISVGGKNAVDAVVYCGGVNCGYLPHNVAKHIRAIYGNTEYNCTVATVHIGENAALTVNIKLPYDYTAKTLPIKTTLSGVTFENRQQHIAQSVVGDVLTVRHAPRADFADTVEVYNNATNQSVGVIPAEIAAKLLKKYGVGCSFVGVITSIYGGSVGKNLGIEIYLLTLSK